MRKLTVGNDNVVTLGRNFIETVFAVGTVFDDVAAFAQTFGKVFGGLQIIFDQKQLHI
jgi:hypothetical protein